MPCDRQNTQAIIYIPLRIYFNQVRGSITISFNDIYIPLCIYFNKKDGQYLTRQCKFTFHHVSISTFIIDMVLRRRSYLHSTMYLFQLAITDMSDNANKIFTFHYVSISTFKAILAPLVRYSLHSTMYLFQPEATAMGTFLAMIFTFHYVSISTCMACSVDRMYSSFTFHYVSISTKYIPPVIRGRIIYIPLCIYFNKLINIIDKYGLVFTFHYVSISTILLLLIQTAVIHLHSTMYLFQHSRHILLNICSDIYIPLCIYFNKYIRFVDGKILLFTFHYVSISTCN